MKTIPLTRGLVALVDDSDYQRLSKFKWNAMRSNSGRTWYAKRQTSRKAGSQCILMHVEILGGGAHIDHRNGNGLDNQRVNLRHATRSQNMHNRSGKGRWKGVFRNGKARWMARIMVDRKLHYLGTYNTPEEAALAYNRAAARMVPDFALLNSGAAVRISPRKLAPKVRRRLAPTLSGYKGVQQRAGYFRARIFIGGRSVVIGKFPSAIEAARAYNESAKKHFGELAILNVL